MAKQTSIIEFIGPLGSGKTTLAAQMIQELSPATLLYIDASLDQRLTTMMAPNPPEQTLTRLVGHIPEPSAPNREAIDWSFHDLTVSVGEEGDLLTLGALPETLPKADIDALAYGLNRLLENYDYAVIDGFHPVLHAVLPSEITRTVIVLTPSYDNGLSAWAENLHTPAVILNQSQDNTLPAALEKAILERKVSLIGKLPHYANAETCIQQLPDDFHNCLLKLNIPLNQGPARQL